MKINTIYLQKTKDLIFYMDQKRRLVFVSILSLVLVLELSNLILNIFFSEKVNYQITQGPGASTIELSKDPFASSLDSNANKILDFIKAPETNLSLKLFGVTSSDDKNFATIGVNKKDQKAYVPGDLIQDNVYLESIQKDFVTISRSGISESLSFDKSSVITGIELAETKKEKKNFENWLSGQSVDDLLSFTPIIENGLLIGLEVSPGEDSRLYDELELIPGDILISINGMNISELNIEDNDSIESFLESTNALNFLIKRGEDQINLNFDVGKI